MGEEEERTSEAAAEEASARGSALSGTQNKQGSRYRCVAGGWRRRRVPVRHRRGRTGGELKPFDKHVSGSFQLTVRSLWRGKKQSSHVELDAVRLTVK